MAVLCFFSATTLAQSEEAEVLEEAPAEPEPPPQRVRVVKPARASKNTSISDDYFKPCWNTTRLDHGIGFNGSFLGVGNSFIYEKDLTRARSWSFYL